MSHSADVSPPIEDERDRPTSVRYGVVSLATAMAVLLYLDRFCLSFAERYIKTDLDLDNDQTSLMLSAFSWTYALGQVPSGWLSDRYGARRMLALYIVTWSICTGLIGVAGTFLGIVLLRFGVGLGQAGAYPTSANLLSKWVPFSARGFASGVVSMGGRIGGVAAPVLTAYLLLAFMPLDGQGWRPTMIVYGVAGLVVAAVFWFVVRDHPNDHPSCNTAERALIEEGQLVKTSHRAEGLPFTAMLASSSLWCSSISQFGTNLGWSFLTMLLPRYLLEVHDVPTVERGWMTGLPIFVGLFGMLAGGWLTDRLTRRLGLRWGRSLPIVLSRFLGLAGYVGCLFLDSPWLVTLALCVVTIATDLGTASVWAFMQDIGGKHVGSVLGWGNMWGNFGAALSPLVLNWAVGGFGWNGCFLCCAGSYLFSGLAALGVDARKPIVPADSTASRLKELASEMVDEPRPLDEHIRGTDDRTQRGG